MKTVVVDPRRIGIGANADMLLQARPGTDGALALALIHCLIEESWYDVEFVRRWTNGMFLLNMATGAVVTEADLSSAGSRNRFVVWDEANNETVIYDPDTGTYARDNVRPALFGTRALRSKRRRRNYLSSRSSNGSARSPPNLRRRNLQKSPGCRPSKFGRRRSCWRTTGPLSMYMWNGVGQHTNATQTSRAIASLYALLGDFDRQGGNVTFPKAADQQCRRQRVSSERSGGAAHRPREKAARPAGIAGQLRRLRYLHRDPRRDSPIRSKRFSPSAVIR